MAPPQLGYVNVFARDFDAVVSFFTDTFGLALRMRDDDHGYASFDAGPSSFAIARTDDDALVGRHTGVGFIVEDIDQAYEALAAQGVEFEMAPTRQPWGGTLALMKDPDGNIHYLDPGGTG